jgi:hypothetical protein
MEASNINTTVGFDGKAVTITRRRHMGVAPQGVGTKTIPIASITAVQWKPAGRLTGGFLQFTLPGGVERNSGRGRQTAQARNDENSVLFTRAQEPAFTALRAAIQAAIASRAGSPASDLASQLQQLADLHATGALSDGEYEAAKGRLLSP